MTCPLFTVQASNIVQLYNLKFTDSCGDAFDIIFVANYDPVGTDPVERYCPLGG